MAYTLLQNGGIAGGASRNIVAPSFNGTDTIILSAAMTHNAGDMVRFTGTLTNDGVYVIVAKTSTTQFRVNPTPTNEAPQGTAQRIGVEIIKQGSTAVTTFGAANTITCAGALFMTKNVRKNDRVVILGSTSNDRAWYVQSVISETQITVRPLNGLAALTVEAAAGNLSVRQGQHAIEIVDEATTSWSALASATFGGGSLGSGVAADFFTYTTFWQRGANSHSLCLIENGLGGEALQGGGGQGAIRVVITVSTGVTDWTSEKEVVVNTADRGPSASNVRPAITVGFEDRTVGADAGLFTLDIGRRGSDRFAASRGSYWFGVYPGSTKQTTPVVQTDHMVVRVSGSVVLDDEQVNMQRGSELVASLFGPTLSAPSSSISAATPDTLVESCIITASDIVGNASAGLAATDPGQDGDNNLITDQDQAGGLVFTGATPVVLSGLLKSGDVISPMYQVFSSLAEALDPREPYTTAELFQVIGGSDSGAVKYTFNPRFVHDVSGVPTPVVGLFVELIEINEATSGETSVFTGTTDAGGLLNAGAGVILERELRTNSSNVSKSHRIIVEGLNWRAINQVFRLVSRVSGDFLVLPQETDFEGEFSKG